jgi:hypothetical protein
MEHELDGWAVYALVERGRIDLRRVPYDVAELRRTVPPERHAARGGSGPTAGVARGDRRTLDGWSGG